MTSKLLLAIQQVITWDLGPGFEGSAPPELELLTHFELNLFQSLPVHLSPLV